MIINTSASMIFYHRIKSTLPDHRSTEITSVKRSIIYDHRSVRRPVDTSWFDIYLSVVSLVVPRDSLAVRDNQRDREHRKDNWLRHGV